MFSNPNLVDWVSGTILVVILFCILVTISTLMAQIMNKIFGEKELGRQAEEGTHPPSIPEPKRTAA